MMSILVAARSKIRGGDRTIYTIWPLYYGNPIESQSYSHNTGTKDNRIETNGICSVCYVGLGPFISKKHQIET